MPLIRICIAIAKKKENINHCWFVFVSIPFLFGMRKKKAEEMFVVVVFKEEKKAFAWKAPYRKERTENAHANWQIYMRIFWIFHCNEVWCKTFSKDIINLWLHVLKSFEAVESTLLSF